MATISSGIKGDANFMNLEEIPSEKVRSEVHILLVDHEKIVQCFQTVRDQVVFTDKRVIVINVQGLVGKKVSYFSYPYSNVLYFGIETAGVLDIDSELVMTFANGATLQFDFKTKVDIKSICADIQKYIL